MSMRTYANRQPGVFFWFDRSIAWAKGESS